MENEKQMTNEFMWTLIQKHGIIETDSVQENMNRALEKEIRERHEKSFEGICKPQKITPPRKDSKRPMWQTYILEDGKLKRLQVKDKDEFFKRLADLYIDNCTEKLPSPKSFWSEYYNKRSSSRISKRTLAKDCDMYRKFIKDAEILDKPVDEISRRDIQRWIETLLDTVGMRKQEFSDVRRIVRELFELAIDHKYLSVNPVESIKSNRKTKRSTPNTDPCRFYSEEEFYNLQDYFWEKFKEDGNSHRLAVLFTMGLALRSGELVALRWEDIIVENGQTVLYVHRREVKNCTEVTEDGAKTDGYVITEHCKANSDRKLVLDDELLHILECQRELNHDNDGFIFGNGERMTSRQLSWQYERACADLGILVRRNHTMRRTVASLLFDYGVNPVYIQHLLGHETLDMTYAYIGRTKPESADRAQATMILNRHQKSPKIYVA